MQGLICHARLEALCCKHLFLKTKQKFDKIVPRFFSTFHYRKLMVNFHNCASNLHSCLNQETRTNAHPIKKNMFIILGGKNSYLLSNSAALYDMWSLRKESLTTAHVSISSNM